MADVRVEALAERVQFFRLRAGVGGQVSGAVAEIGMIGEHAGDRVVGGRVVACEGREQDVLLDSEVTASFGIPEGEERFACGFGGRLGGAVEPLGYDEAVVMVSRKLSEGVAAFHWHIVVVPDDVTRLRLLARGWGETVDLDFAIRAVGIVGNEAFERGGGGEPVEQAARETPVQGAHDGLVFAH